MPCSKRPAEGDRRIQFCGSFPNDAIGEVFSSLDVLVVPSTWYENAPLVIYSAQAARCPVIAANLGGMAEIIHHEDNGLLFTPGSVEELARTLRRLCDDRKLLEYLSKRAVMPRSIEDYVHQIEAVYEDIFSKSAASSPVAGREVEPAPTSPSTPEICTSFIENPDYVPPYRVTILKSAVGKRPKVLHVIANFMTGGSSRLVVDLVEHMGHEYEQEVLTSYVPSPAAYEGLPVQEVRNWTDVNSIRDTLTTFSPDLVHVHYWGDCDKNWYEQVFLEARARRCKIIQNINTPVNRTPSMALISMFM